MDKAKVTVRAKRDDVKPQDMVGKEVTVSLVLDHNGNRRKFNYLVIGISQKARLTRGLREYVFKLRPTWWLMSQRSDCRKFISKTVVQIAEILCHEHGIKLDTSRVFDLPPAQNYTVQWKETDLDFLLRLCQKYGIFYWTRQDNGKQVLVLTNKPIGYDKGADGDKGRTRIASGSTADNHISEWQTDYLFVPGKHAGRDWNFEDPNRPQQSSVISTVKLPRNISYEFYQYPALAMSGRDAEKQITNHAQASEAAHQTIVGASDVRELAAGAKVTPFDLANPSHVYETAVIMSIEHTAVNQSYETTEGDTEPDYSNTFTALLASLPATPQRTIPRPRIDGTLPAIIAGPEGEEIHCDKFGRVKVYFQWDRQAKKNGNDTDWIRVVQPWAGGGWGMQVIPRIGMEAIVLFEDGDPDRPLIIGLLPNPNMKVPYNLPGDKTRMVMKSQTHKGSGFNELSFEDQNGQQEIYMHAEKDMNTHVKNNQSNLIEGHQSTQINGKQIENIQFGTMINAGGSYSVHVGPTGTNFLSLLNIFGNANNIFKQALYNLPFLGVVDSISNSYNVTAAGQINMSSLGVLALGTGGTMYHRAVGNITMTSSRTIEAFATRNMNIRAKEITQIAANRFYAGSKDISIELTDDGALSIKGLKVEVEAKEVIIIGTESIKLKTSK